MESVSLILIIVGAVIIGAVLLVRLGLRNRTASQAPRPAQEPRIAEPEFDPLFAIDVKKKGVSPGDLDKLGGIAAEKAEPRMTPYVSASTAIPKVVQESPSKSDGKRNPPRVAEDPHRVVVLNVMSGEDKLFLGHAVRSALESAGFEHGDWQIFHYYSSKQFDAPPLFSLANMVKPGNFDLGRMDTLSTPGLSLFMVPAGADDDIAVFDTMLATARRLAQDLGGEVRDARRSVLTRQAIAQIREQLNEWRCKVQVAHH